MDYERTDLVSDLPENCQYKDEGCELADSCLNCPFPDCVYDLRGGERRQIKVLRDKEMKRLYLSGVSSQDIANRFRVCRRTVQRATTLRNMIHDSKNKKNKGRNK